MMGYVRRARAPVGAKAAASANVAGVTAQSNSHPGINSSPNAAVAPDQSAPAGRAATPVHAQKNGTQASASTAPPVGGLVVYDNGKVIFQSPPQSPSQTKTSASRPVKVPSKVADEYLLQRVEPEYPEAARQQHIQGPVVLEALVGKDGAVENLSTISGDPQLTTAATDAVRQWRFKPFFRNGSPEEFRTQITVSFRLP
jgi:TonB family protein